MAQRSILTSNLNELLYKHSYEMEGMIRDLERVF